MYIINKNKINELKYGRTIKYIADQLGVTSGFISSVFNQKKKCSLIIAKGIISIKENIAINDIDIDKKIEKFFKKV